MSIIESNTGTETDTTPEVDTSTPETDAGNADQVEEKLPVEGDDIEDSSESQPEASADDEALAEKMFGEFAGSNDPFASFEQAPEAKQQAKAPAKAPAKDAKVTEGGNPMAAAFDLDAMEQADIEAYRDDLGTESAQKFAKANRARTEAILAHAQTLVNETVRQMLGPVIPSIKAAHQSALAQQFREIDESVDKWAGTQNAHLVGKTDKMNKVQSYVRTALVRKASTIAQNVPGMTRDQAYSLALPIVLSEMKQKGFKVGSIKSQSAPQAPQSRIGGQMLAASAASTTKPSGRPAYNAKAEALAAMRSVRQSEE